MTNEREKFIKSLRAKLNFNHPIWNFHIKEILQCGTLQKVVCYCDYDSEDGFCLGENHTCCWTNSKILHPATKEQYYFLFQKIKEAGYKWDVEKKELTKL